MLVWKVSIALKFLTIYSEFHFCAECEAKDPSPPVPLISCFLFLCFQMCWWMGSHVTAMSLPTVKWVTLWPWRYNWPIGARTQWAPWLWLWCLIRTSRTESRTTIWRTRSPSLAPTPSTLTRSVGARVLYRFPLSFPNEQQRDRFNTVMSHCGTVTSWRTVLSEFQACHVSAKCFKHSTFSMCNNSQNLGCDKRQYCNY